jgi:hypothetical protein
MFAQCGHAERRLFRAQGHFPAYRCRACEGDPQANPPDVRLSPLRALKLHMSRIIFYFLQLTAGSPNISVLPPV